MTAAAVWGLLGGAATLGISELLLRWRGAMSTPRLWKVSMWGVAIRTAWVLGVLVAGVGVADLEPRAFTIALLAGYFAAQITEGIRYQRLIGMK